MNLPEEFPDFIGLGAQKAATSWIHACLMDHPGAFLPPAKEIHFFSRNYHRGRAWYAQHFRLRRPGLRSGEISPSYLYDQETPRRIFRWNPQVRLFACLRNPIERAASAYRYATTRGYGLSVATLREVFAMRPEYLEQGLYFEQLSRYFSWFPREQILLTVYDDISKDPLGFIRRIYGFLDLEQDVVPRSLSETVNPSSGAPRFRWLDRTVRGAAELARRAGLERPVWHLARSRVRRVVDSLNHKDAKMLSLSDAERIELADFFAKDIESLAQLLGRNLAGEWLPRRSQKGSAASPEEPSVQDGTVPEAPGKHGRRA
jgi:hypothetical protein